MTITINIDKLSNEVMTDSEISSRVGATIASQYPKEQELKLMRLYLADLTNDTNKANFEAYHQYVEEARAAGTLAKKEAALVRAAIEAESAPALAEGETAPVLPADVQALVDERIAARPVVVIPEVPLEPAVPSEVVVEPPVATAEPAPTSVTNPS